ncbi:MAG: DNA-binding response regulator [Acidobacteriaceae bacterium]|nr:DNA-binding response regulator [Acidobacteriaceae bacterium]
MNTFRILLADDHPVFRMGVSSLIRSHEGWEVCGEADDGREAVKKCMQLKPDLLMLDICMPNLNGVDAARQILKHNPDQRILVVTNVEAEHVIRECLEAGVCGWVLKSDKADELAEAIEAMQRHRSSFSSRVSNLILDGYLQPHRQTPSMALPPRLSPREREVVLLVSEGKTSREIATLLGVTVKTAESHRSNVMLKLKLHSTVELVMYALKNQIIPLELPTVDLPAIVLPIHLPEIRMAGLARQAAV